MKLKLKPPTIAILVYLAVLLAGGYYVGLPIQSVLSESMIKFAMNGIMVLSLLPMIHSGIGLNFGMPVGLSAALVGMSLAIQFKLQGVLGFLSSLVFSLLIAAIFGFGYGKLLNRLKWREEIAGVFIGFAFIPLMNIFWTVAPFTNRQMLYPVGGVGLRPKISLDGYFRFILDETMVFQLGEISIPLGLLLFYTLTAAVIALIFKSRTGKAMAALRLNAEFARLSGVNENRVRLMAVILSTALAAVGMCVYSQSFGFVQLYDGASMLTFPALSALLIGGGGGRQASIINAVVGAYLYQFVYLLSVPVANAILIPELAELTRMIITNGVILFAMLMERRWQHA